MAVTAIEDQDVLFENRSSNIANGYGGGDILFGLGGHDSLFGGNGTDVLNGGIGLIDHLFVCGGDDIYLIDRNASHVFIGGPSVRRVGEFDRIVFTNIAFDEVSVSFVYYPDAGNPAWLEHGLALDISWSECGATGRTRVVQEGSDFESFEFADGISLDAIKLRAIAGNNIVASDSDDWIIGASAADVMTGGLGADIFQLSDGAGTHAITDFTDGSDILRFSGLVDLGKVSITQIEDDTQISFGGASVVLLNVDSTNISLEDFHNVSPAPVSLVEDSFKFDIWRYRRTSLCPCMLNP